MSDSDHGNTTVVPLSHGALEITYPGGPKNERDIRRMEVVFASVLNLARLDVARLDCCTDTLEVVAGPTWTALCRGAEWDAMLEWRTVWCSADLVVRKNLSGIPVYWWNVNAGNFQGPVKDLRRAQQLACLAAEREEPDA